MELLSLWMPRRPMKSLLRKLVDLESPLRRDILEAWVPLVLRPGLITSAWTAPVFTVRPRLRDAASRVAKFVSWPSRRGLPVLSVTVGRYSSWKLSSPRKPWFSCSREPGSSAMPGSDGAVLARYWVGARVWTDFGESTLLRAGERNMSVAAAATRCEADETEVSAASCSTEGGAKHAANEVRGEGIAML